VDVINIAADRQVYDTHRRTKLTALETISRSRIWLCPPKRPFQGCFTIHRLAIATDNVSTKFEVCISTRY